jgi:hypothetical protein
MSDHLWFHLSVASGGLLVAFVALRTRPIHARRWLLFTTLVAIVEAILLVVLWRDSMGVEEPLQSAMPFSLGFTCAFAVGLAVYFARYRSTTFRVAAAVAVTVLTTACAQGFMLFLGCTFGPCI